MVFLDDDELDGEDLGDDLGEEDDWEGVGGVERGGVEEEEVDWMDGCKRPMS